jgi:hypothetical protein
MKLQVLVVLAVVIGAAFYLKIVKVDDLTRYQCRSKQSEAKAMLKEAQKRLGDEALKSGRVPKTWPDLAWQPKTKRYDFFILDAGTSHFTVEARAQTDEMNGDVWQIDEGSNLTNKVDGCKRR